MTNVRVKSTKFKCILFFLLVCVGLFIWACYPNKTDLSNNGTLCFECKLNAKNKVLLAGEEKEVILKLLSNVKEQSLLMNYFFNDLLQSFYRYYDPPSRGYVYGFMYDSSKYQKEFFVAYNGALMYNMRLSVKEEDKLSAIVTNLIERMQKQLLEDACQNHDVFNATSKEWDWGCSRIPLDYPICLVRKMWKELPDLYDRATLCVGDVMSVGSSGDYFFGKSIKAEAMFDTKEFFLYSTQKGNVSFFSSWNELNSALEKLGIQNATKKITYIHEQTND